MRGKGVREESEGKEDDRVERGKRRISKEERVRESTGSTVHYITRACKPVPFPYIPGSE